MTGTFDARIVRKNDSEKGLFITLEITGDDYYGAVSQFRPGTLLKLQYEELDGDTGAPKEQASAGAASKVSAPLATAAQQGGEGTAALNTPAPGAGKPDGGDVDQTDSASPTEKPRQPVDDSLSAKPHRKFSELRTAAVTAMRDTV